MDAKIVLNLLKAHYGSRWHIRTTGTLWIATAVDKDTDREPTVIESDLERFIAKLEKPGPRYGNGHPLLKALGWTEDAPGLWSPPE